MNSDLFFAPANEATCAIHQGRISATELAQQMLARIERHNPVLNAVKLTSPELTLAAAADETLAKGESAGRTTVRLPGLDGEIRAVA